MRFFSLPGIRAQAALAVRTHDPNPRGPQELVRIPRISPSFVPRNADADDLFLLATLVPMGRVGLNVFGSATPGDPHRQERGAIFEACVPTVRTGMGRAASRTSG